MELNQLVENIVNLKNEYLEEFHSYNPIREFVPVPQEQNMLDRSHLEKLHTFFKYNNIYFKQRAVTLSDIPCTSYEGDVNQFWLSSKKYDTNYQPFLPTWGLSAFVMCLAVKNLGFQKVLDIGSGDGRLLYCGSILGLDSAGIEIDKDLCKLQNEISSYSGVKYNVIHGDSNTVDYSQFNLENTMIFISALPELGEMIAHGVVNQLKRYRGNLNNIGITLMGSQTYRKYSRDKSMYGWGKFIADSDLKVLANLSLPSSWTLEEKKETPYLFTSLK